MQLRTKTLCLYTTGCFKICITLSFHHIFVINQHSNSCYTFFKMLTNTVSSTTPLDFGHIDIYLEHIFVILLKHFDKYYFMIIFSLTNLESRSNLFFPLVTCLCLWNICVLEDTCRQGVFLSTSVDMKYCDWLRSIFTLKSKYNKILLSILKELLIVGSSA